MTRILTVDDSRAIRSIVSKQVQELGFDIDEAEDGEQGLARLEECQYDLVILDVTMPVLDGPGMLAKMREAGNKTPVLMLTSESKRSIIMGVMKDGIEDYILKPFKPEELRAKIFKGLKMAPPVGGGAVAAVAAPEPTVQAASMDGGGVTAGRQFIDVLVVDDMENVPKKLRTMLPQHLTMNHSASAHAALTLTRERVYRVIIIDIDIPDVNSATLVRQLRLLQPQAAFFALCLRSANDLEAENRKLGFDGTMYKPFDAGAIEDFVNKYFDVQEAVVDEDNLLTVSAFTGKENRLLPYFDQLSPRIEKLLEKSAAACYDEVILDVTKIPVRRDRVPRLIAGVHDKAGKMGIDLRVVGTQELRDLLAGIEDTRKIRFFETVPQARSCAA